MELTQKINGKTILNTAVFDNLDSLAKFVYEQNKAKGFWESDRPLAETCILMVSESIEALEILRDKSAKKTMIADFFEVSYLDDHAYHDLFKKFIKDSFEDEIADIVIRLLDFSGKYDLKIEAVNPNVTAEFSENDAVNLYQIVKLIVRIEMYSIYKSNEPFLYSIEVARKLYDFCMEIAEKKGFDLKKHILLKLLYNASRPAKHGKNF